MFRKELVFLNILWCLGTRLILGWSSSWYYSVSSGGIKHFSTVKSAKLDFRHFISWKLFDCSTLNRVIPIFNIGASSLSLRLYSSYSLAFIFFRFSLPKRVKKGAREYEELRGNCFKLKTGITQLRIKLSKNVQLMNCLK